MVITVPESRSTSEGVRPVDLVRDVPQIVELLRMVFGETLEADDRHFLGQASATSMSDLLTRMNPAAARLASGFVYVDRDRVVGNVTLLSTKVWGRFLVANVAVHPSYRRRGIARLLMDTVTQAVSQRGGRVILLQVVKDNLPAIALYRSLGYTTVGSMATWQTPSSRLRQILVDDDPGLPEIRPLAGRQWRAAYALDTACVPADLNWPEPLTPDAYRRGVWRRLSDFMSGRQSEVWVTADGSQRLSGLASLQSEWGRSHLVAVRVRQDMAGRLERPLLAKAIRRLYYLPRRTVRIDHPDDDRVMTELLQEANFTVQRTLTHMRLDLVRT